MAQNENYRKIIHIDMDAFYASVEQRDNPALRGKPVAVGHAEGRGVVAAVSYEARRFGVRSAMPSGRAKRLCPDLIFVDGRFDVYKKVSAQMHDIFHRYTDIIEPISLDEAFLDVTVNKRGIELAVEIAREIKQSIRQEMSLVASAGVSYNKFLAKIASDHRKPDGLCTIHPSQALDFIAKVPIEDFWGVGPVTAKRMHEIGITNGLELRQRSVTELVAYFGKAGKIYYDFARGIDNREVEAVRQRKSVGCEVTLEHDISDHADIDAVIVDLAHDLKRRLTRSGFEGSTLTLKVKFGDFTQITRSVTTSDAILEIEQIIRLASQLADNVDTSVKPVRLLGLSVGHPLEIADDTAANSLIEIAPNQFVEPSGQLLIDFRH